MKKKKHLQIFFPLIRHTLLLSNLWKYLYKCNTRDDLEKDQTRQRIRSEVTRARTHILCVCVRAWARMKAIILRARVIFAIEGRAERVAEREGRWGGRRNIIKGERRRGTSRAGNAPDVEEEREEISSLSFDSLSLTRFPFVPGFDRGSTKLLLPPAVVRSKSSASSPLSTFNRRWQLNTGRPYENYHFFYVNRTYANCSDLRLPNRCFHHLLSSFKCQFFSLLHFFISCYKQKIFRGLISRS